MSTKLDLLEHPDQPVLILNPGSGDAEYVSIDTGVDYDDIAEKDEEEDSAEGASDEEVVPERLTNLSSNYFQQSVNLNRSSSKFNPKSFLIMVFSHYSEFNVMRGRCVLPQGPFRAII